VVTVLQEEGAQSMKLLARFLSVSLGTGTRYLGLGVDALPHECRESGGQIQRQTHKEGFVCRGQEMARPLG